MRDATAVIEKQHRAIAALNQRGRFFTQHGGNVLPAVRSDN